MTTRFTAPMQARRGDARGQVLVLFALMLVVLLLVSALAVDYGGWLVTKRSYQNVSDAAALAGAQQLTRPLSTACPSGATKNFCARQAAWESVKAALNFTALDPAARADTSLTPSSTPYSENGYTVWVASPPKDAGSAYVGHVSGPGNVYVRIDHAAQNFLSGIAGINRKVQAWATAGRFPANFAVIGLCSPTSVTANCLAGDANIKLDGNNTNLIVNTGDVGTNRWTKSGGNNSGVALGVDSNAYMQLFDTCWNSGGNQCNLYGYSAGVIDTSDVRAAIPLGAPIPDPLYPAPTINATTTSWRCYPTSVSPPGVTLASLQLDGGETSDPSQMQLVAFVGPIPAPKINLAAGSTISGTITQTGGANVPNGVTVELLNSLNVVIGSDTTKSGVYSIKNIADGTGYTIRATQAGTPPTLHTTTGLAFDVSGSNVTQNLVMQLNPIITGTIRDSGTSAVLSNVTITVTGPGGPYSSVTNASGVYSLVVYYSANSAFTVTGTKSGYSSNSGSVGANVANLDTTTTVNFNLTPVPASLTGTITDQTTGLAVPNVTVTLSSGESATTNASGVYNIASTSQGTKTVTLSGTSMVGYAYSTPATPGSVALSGATTQNYTLWPKGCSDANRDRGDWSCSFPSGNNCPATTNKDAANVTCTFTQANAIRPGTYHDITIDGCAWLDPRGGVTGLAAGQSAGIYHITGTINLRGDSYLFGDGVTIVFNQGASIDVANGGGFVLNYGTHSISGAAACNNTTDLTTPFAYGDAGNICFRTVSAAGAQDYAYAAWTIKGHAPWGSSTSPTYDDSVVQKTQGDLGVTFYMFGSGLGNASRFKIATANMGYLFNGVLYAPNDDVQLGGGKNGQTAAGQIVGWTIEYHGGTAILQNWYGPPIDGQPFLIEPVLGE